MKKLNNLLLLISVALMMTACGTTLKDYQGFIEKYPQNRYCALAVEPIANGMTDDAVRLSRVGSHTHCDNSESSAQSNAISYCSNRTGKSCVLAYTYDRNNHRYRSNQATNIREQQNAIIEAKMQKCDAYGFKRGTTPFAQCLQQIEQQEAIDSANQMQANELNRQASERQWRKTQCYASGRLDC